MPSDIDGPVPPHSRHEPLYPVTVPPDPEDEATTKKKSGKTKKKTAEGAEEESVRLKVDHGWDCPTCHTHLRPRESSSDLLVPASATLTRLNLLHC